FLGGLVRLRVNPARDEAAACAIADAVAHGLSGTAGFTFHPYPVTPFHGDYLYHADRAETAAARFREAPSMPPSALKIKAEGALAAVLPPSWRTEGEDWDAVVEVIDAAALVGRSLAPLDGWLGP